MGNCQAVDAAALVIQHPNGKVQRMYWSITANEVMKMNPGHYVSLIIPLPLSENQTITSSTTTTGGGDRKTTVRYTRVKLLRSTDTLVLGRAYRLVTSQEVKKVLQAKRMAKTKMKEMELTAEKSNMSQRKETEEERLKSEDTDHDVAQRQEKHRIRSGSMNSRSKTWRPSLQSISEAVS